MITKVLKKFLQKKNINTVDFFLDKVSRKMGGATFMQVGANDGKDRDPFYAYIHRYNWTGVIVEPQADVFKLKLSENYKHNPRVKLKNVAIHDHAGKLPIYKYSFSTSRWATGMASFDKERLIKNFNSDYVKKLMAKEGVSVVNDPDVYLTTEMVECIPFDLLLKQENISNLDILITDVEGYDVHILKTFPFEKIRPTVIIFELPVTFDSSLLDFSVRLRQLNYNLFFLSNDCFAVDRNFEV